jgi:hypothetical protein
MLIIASYEKSLKLTLMVTNETLTPENCLGYHESEIEKAKAHICNKCYNPSKGYDMEYF